MMIQNWFLNLLSENHVQKACFLDSTRVHSTSSWRTFKCARTNFSVRESLTYSTGPKKNEKYNWPMKEQQSGCQIAVKFGTINLCWNQSHFPNHLQTGFLSLITSLWSRLYIELSHIIMVRSIFSQKLHISRNQIQSYSLDRSLILVYVSEHERAIEDYLN